MWNLLQYAIVFFSLAPSTFGNPVQILGSSSTTTQPSELDITVRNRPEPSEYPWADPNDPIHAIMENEFKWLGWDKENAEDKRDGQKIHQAFREWHDLARAAADGMDNYHSARFTRWFRGGDEGDNPSPKNVISIFESIINRSTGVAGVGIARMVLHREEVPENPGRPCAERPQMNAYTIPGMGAIHFCRRGINLPLNSELRCEDFTESVSGKMKSVSMTFFHELM